MAHTLASAARFYLEESSTYYTMDFDQGFTIQADAVVDETTSKVAAWYTGVPVLCGVTFSGSGVHVAGDTGTDAAQNNVLGITTAAFKFKTINSQMWSGTAIFENFTLNSDNPNNVRYSFSGRATGPVTVGAAS